MALLAPLGQALFRRAYLIQATLSAGNAPPANVQTEVQVKLSQTTTLPSGGAPIASTALLTATPTPRSALMLRHILLGLCLFSPLLSAADSSILHRWDFEGDHPFHDLKIEGEPPVVIRDPLNPANKVMHAVLKPHAERAERSEVRFDRIDEGQERWVGCRIFRPDQEQFRRVCIFQLGPISGAPGHGGRGLYQILAKKVDDNLTWTFKGYLSRVTEKDFETQAGPIVVGAWDDWVMHLKLRSDDHGHIVLWRNGQKIEDRSGKNAFPGDRIAVKWGAYIGAGNVTEQETNAYFDDVVIGNETACYEDVSPGKKSPLP